MNSNIPKTHADPRALVSLKDRTAAITGGDVLAFVVCRDEIIRLKYFLSYYRNLGVSHFMFVDNDSSDGTKEYLIEQPDCSVWTTRQSYRDSNFGVQWTNYLLRRYGVNHWCLTLDPDEFLVFPYYGNRDLRDLCDYLASSGRISFFSLLLDMYPLGPIGDAIYHDGQDPLEVAPYFDPQGYCFKKSPLGGWWVRGGVRRRVFFAETPEKSPALNKTVLVRWKHHYAYTSSTHTLVPSWLNNAHPPNGLAPTGCLLHFKFLSHFKDKVDIELHRKQHYNNSLEYKHYAEHLALGGSLHCDASLRYLCWQQLVNLGLMNIGRWF
jgi:hypothetical protein